MDSVINDISDKDEQWGPLLFLRPARDKPMGLSRVLGLAVLLGGLFGVIGNIVLAITARSVGRPIPPAYVMPLALIAVYFLVCRFTVAAAWNRRARRLASFRAAS